MANVTKPVFKEDTIILLMVKLLPTNGQYFNVSPVDGKVFTQAALYSRRCRSCFGRSTQSVPFVELQHQ
jgi:hypothetical protein